MKEVVIAFILALCFSCVLAGYQTASSPIPTAIRELAVVEHQNEPAEIGNIMIGESKVVNSDFEPLTITEVKTSGSKSSSIRFPQFGKFE